MKWTSARVFSLMQFGSFIGLGTNAILGNTHWGLFACQIALITGWLMIGRWVGS
jgi:hypothetical protein